MYNYEACPMSVVKYRFVYQIVGFFPTSASLVFPFFCNGILVD